MRRASAFTRALAFLLIASFLLSQSACKKNPMQTESPCDGSESGCDQ